MDRRRAAGTLLALAVCISCSAAAPTASNNQTALDVYDGPSEGCYYNFQSYSEGDRIMTNEPCLNCTCHNRMLMCYLRVCPFTKPIGQDCTVEKRADQCCPIVTCPDVPVDLLTSTSTTSPAEYGNTGIGRVDKYGCEINGKYFPEGAKVQSSPNKPCEHCYCIRNMTTCVMQECTLHVEGCTPIYNKDVCCPVRYSCDHPEDEIPLLDDMTTTVRPTPGFLLTTTTLAPLTQSSQECVHDDQIFPDGALIKTEKACEHCYCMKGDIVCVVQECGTPMENEGKNCTSVAPREGQCCPDTYICDGDDQTTEVPYEATSLYEPDEATTTPPRRVGIEGSGYRNEDETPTIEPDVEGSGEEPAIDIITKTEAPEKETEIIDDGFLITKTPHHSSTSTATQEPEVSSEPDKGLNTVPDVAPQEEFTKSPFTNKASETEEEPKLTTTPIYQTIPEQQATTESSLLETTNILPLEESATTHLSSIPEAENIATELPVTTGKSESETGTTYKPLLDTTTMNVVENEIDEGTNLYPSPGRIPGEGDCLLNGITYNNESSVPSSSKCHSSCKCISSIIKCEPILCSPPPEYMDNCQPIYDSPESCCPTYICDHSKETIPPQPHSQMTETVSSTTAPDCDDDQCKVNVVQPSECSGNDCQVTLKETSQGPVECSGTECKLTTQEIPPKEPNLNECTDEECKIAMKIPLDSAVSEKEPSSVTEQSDIATNDCSGDNCGEKVFEKEPSSVTESPESSVLPDKELSSTKSPDLIPTEVPDKESSVTTELFKPEDTSDKEPIPEIKPENEVKEPTATESSEATELPDKKLTESECTGDDCKTLEKESAAATTEASITPVKELTGYTESSLDVEKPAGECNGADCKDIEKEMPASTESSDTLNKEQLATTVSSLSEDKETDKCSGDGCKEIEKESTVPTESSEASTMAIIEPSTSTEHAVPEDLPTSECSGDNCKVIEKEPPMPSEPAEIPHEDSPTSTELSLPAEIPTSECNGQDCQVSEKEASGSSEPTPTSKTEIADVTEPTAQCDGDGCQIIEKEPAGVTEPAEVFEKEPSASTEPAVLAETTATDCNGDDCKIIKNEPSSSITTESPAVPSECIGDACAVKEEEPSAATETSLPAETPEKDFAATEPSIVQETTFKEPSIGTEPSEAPEEPMATTEPTGLEEKPNKELSSATESSLPEETPEQKPSDVTEHPEILDVDRLPTTEPSKLYQESEKEPSATTEVSSLGDLPNTEAPNQNPDVIDTSKPSEEPEKQLSPTTESSDKDLSFVSTPETTPSSEKDVIYTTESSEQSNAESPSATVSPQIPETVTKLSETTELSSPAETSDKETPMVTESSIPADTSDKQSSPTEPTPGKDESIITEPEKSTELADKETNAVTEAAQQPDVECDGTDCKVIGKEPVSPVESTSPDSISITESSTELSSPTSELPEIAISECSGEDCKAIETDATTQSTGDAQVPEKQAQPTATEESNISEKEPSIVTETAVPAVECSDGNCKLDDNKSPAATESSLSTNLPEENPNIIRESTLPTGISEEPSAMTETAQPEIATNGECSGIDCKVIELESVTVSLPSTDLSKTESPAVSEPTTKPKLECSGDDCKLDEKESGATEPTALDQTLTIEKEPTEPSISKNEEPSAQPEPTSDKKPESDCNSDECKATEYEPKPSEDENCKGEGCKTADKTQSVSTELPLLSATKPESACIGDQCQTTGKENLPTTEQPDAIATKEPAVLSESTPTSECVGDDCKSNEKESASTEIPLDTIETECNNDNCRRKQTEEVSSGTISSSPEGVNTESATVEPVTESVSLPDENKATEATEVTTVEIMSQDTSSTPVTEIKDEEQKTEKQPEGVTQAQDSLTSSTEKLPSEKETETKPSIDEVLQEQTTQSSLASQEPTEPAETSTSKPETESETEIPEKQKPVTETTETSSESSNIPADGESITEGVTTPEKDLSQITEKQETLSAEMTTSSPIYDKESENPTTDKEHFTTTIRSEMVETDKTDKPDYHDTEPEKTDNTQFETETESFVEKTTLNADRGITNPVTESLPEQGLTDSDRIAEPDKEEPIPTEAVSVVTSPTATNEVEHGITEKPEDTIQSITTIAPMSVENEETTLADKVKPEYPQTEAPEFNTATTKSTEHSDQTTVSISEENLDNQEAVTTEINVTPELVTKAPESIATESQVKDSEASQYPDDKLSTTSERISPTEIYTTAASEAPEVTSSSTELPKQTLPDLHVTDAHSTIAEDTILGSSTAQTPTHIEPVSSSQPDLQDITEANKDENELKLEEPTTQSIEAEQTTEPKVAYSETTPYQVELELHTHKTPEETSSPADFEASTAFVLTEQSKEPESSTAQDMDHTVEDILKTTEKTDNIIEQQTNKIPFEMPETSSASPDETESKQTDTPVFPTMAYDNKYSLGADEKATEATEAPEEQQTKQPVKSEQATPTNLSEESVSPVTEKVSTEKVEDLPIPTTPQAEKVEEKPIETSTSKPVEMPIDETSEEDGQLPSGPGYGQEPDYVEEDQAFGPGTCRYGGKVYVSAQQIPRDDPCDFCFCFRSDIICLQQSCPPPIHGCHEEPIQGFCCPRYECPVSMATTLNVTTTTTTTTTTLPPHFLPHAYKGAAQRKGCVIKGHTYKVGEVVRASSGPCLHCTCGGDGQMKCDPKVCTPEPMLRQMIAAAVSSKRRR